MNSIPISDIFVVIFVLVDDWYQEYAKEFREGKPGQKPEFSDSEVMTILMAMDFIPFPSERQFIAFVRANYLDLFPRILDQSQFNRRARDVAPLLEEFRQHWLVCLGTTLACEGLLDTKPVPVVGYRRSKKHSDFLDSADYGYCASKKMYYFGYKLVTITTIEGIPLLYDLVPANTDERQAAEELLDRLAGFDLFADKGFLGKAWQHEIHQRTRNRIWTPRRKNQYTQYPAAFQAWLNRLRLRIEGVFNELQNVGKNLERLLAKTVLGLCTRIIAKMASHLLKSILRIVYHIDVLAFSKLNA
jgi:transposase